MTLDLAADERLLASRLESRRRIRAGAVLEGERASSCQRCRPRPTLRFVALHPAAGAVRHELPVGLLLLAPDGVAGGPCDHC